MEKSVSIIDYGIGNILSVQRAFVYVGAEVEFVRTAQEIRNAKRLVLPGVGAFYDGMTNLARRDLVGAIQEYCSQNRPFLGICLGMQMMLDSSEEGEPIRGLGIISGKVKKIENTGTDGTLHKIPHIGWNEIVSLRTGEERCWDGTILEGIGNRERMYFVHSFTAFPDDESNRLADSYYDGRRLAAVIAKGNLYGTQFHPEKSGEYGLKIINNFLQV